ncbi:YchJ family protein [Gephyromycinifex aptenodytis]|uniref:YchJ family protein n=1 Tax=Gephyromycinifex aptenodytis TaxID=2716227 RepID=UPI001445AECE|nr:YchJ family metal-binding protein [Gephyromycinifex aptenodytis]
MSVFGTPSPSPQQQAQCPCGSAEPYLRCCGPLHAGRAQAPTAQALMRSRYSAFVQRRARYLLRTWHPRTRPETVQFPAGRWVGLSVLDTSGGGPSDEHGTVDYRATWLDVAGSAHDLIEHARFERCEGNWVYLDGDVS